MSTSIYKQDALARLVPVLLSSNCVDLEGMGLNGRVLLVQAQAVLGAVVIVVEQVGTLRSG